MPTIEDQIELEKRMVAFGISRYNSGVTKANEKNRGADTGSSQKLLQEFILPVSEAIQEYVSIKTAGINTKYKALLKTLDPDTAAYLGLRAVFDYLATPRALVTLGKNIGMMIEDELKFRRFHESEPEYYETIIKDFKRKGTKNYRHMHRVLTLKAHEKNVSWNSWSKEEILQVGVKILDIIIQSTNLIERHSETKQQSKKYHKTQYTISPTAECLEWVGKFDKYAELLHPDRAPCLIQPDPWISITEGGYYTPQLRLRTPMVKVSNPKQASLFDENAKSVIDAVNILQEVPWQVNKEVYEVLTECWSKSIAIGLPQSEPYVIHESPVPRELTREQMTTKQQEAFDEWKTEARVIHTLNKERVSKCFQVLRVLRMAREYKDYDKFYYVYYCDFRGRIYSSVFGLSPQGADFSKSLLRFAVGKPLTERGLYWLRIHGANTYGEDKLSYSAREQWAVDNENLILAVAEEPISNRELWQNADKPWQFLAFCFEYRRFKREGIGMQSHLPIALDGSCNGLQNFSAMLRDAKGGAATNLVPSETPSDIYTEVADVCTRRLHESRDSMARDWLDWADKENEGFIPRGLAKRPVMTLPYGSTQQSCREYIYKYMIEEAPNAFDKKVRFKMCVFLTPILWASITEVVVAARAGMDWIQRCASIVSKQSLPLMWVTPLGFPVYQSRKVQKSIQIRTELSGNIRIRVNTDTLKIDTQKQRLGASPNFIHSMDATHLMLTLLKARDLGVQHFACIHDDYGTHADDTDKLHKAIREAFIELYQTHNPLQEFKDINEKRLPEPLPDLPSHGTLDLNGVRDSLYFFG